MNEPRRLHEESDSELARALLRAGTSYRASGSARARTLAALGLAGSAAASAGAASFGLSAIVSKLGGAKLLAAVSLLGAIVGVPAGYHLYRRATAVSAAPPSAGAFGPSEPARRAPVDPAPRLLAADAPAAAPEPERAVAEPLRAPRPAVEAAARRAPSARGAARVEPRAPAPAASSPTDASMASADLTLELAALDEARSALRAGEGTRALGLLDAYSRTYPRGRLSLEAEVLRIDALAKSGQRQAARRRAEAFLTRHPKSVLASRVRGYLSD